MNAAFLDVKDFIIVNIFNFDAVLCADSHLVNEECRLEFSSPTGCSCNIVLLVIFCFKRCKKSHAPSSVKHILQHNCIWLSSLGIYVSSCR